MCQFPLSVASCRTTLGPMDLVEGDTALNLKKSAAPDGAAMTKGKSGKV